LLRDEAQAAHVAGQRAWRILFSIFHSSVSLIPRKRAE